MIRINEFHPVFRTLRVKQAIRCAILGYLDHEANTFEHEDKLPVDDGYANDAYWYGRVARHNDVPLRQLVRHTRNQ